MKRIALALFGLALMGSGAGCCCQHLFGNPCNPCGPMYGTTYGSTYITPSTTTAYYPGAPAVSVATVPIPAVSVATVPVTPVY